jgi:hypothetical protein
MSEYEREARPTSLSSQSPDYRSEEQEGTEGLREKAQEYRETTEEKASELGDKAQEQLETGKEHAAGRMERAAEIVRERASGSEGVPAEAASKVAGSMEGAATYLREHSTAEIWSDVEGYAREHPAQAIAGAVFAGFIIGRILR